VHQVHEEFDSDESGELEIDELLRLVARYHEGEVRQASKAFDSIAKRQASPCSSYASSPKRRGRLGSRNFGGLSDQVNLLVLTRYRKGSEVPTISISEVRTVLLACGYMPTKEQEVALLRSLDEGVTQLDTRSVISLVEQFRVWARDEFKENQGYTQKQLGGLRSTFNCYAGGSLTIKDQTVASLLANLYPDASTSAASRAWVEELLQVGGVHHKGYLDFDGYLRIMRSYHDRQDYVKLQAEAETMKQLKFSKQEIIELRQVFTSFDADENGSMDIDELTNLVSIIVPALADDQLEELEHILRQNDTDGDSSICFFEFLKVVNHLQDQNWQGFNKKAADLSSGPGSP
jgi:hypothetical protein